MDLLCAAIVSRATAGATQFTIQDGFASLASDATPLLRESVCALYRDLILNFTPGDELWFFGFSRGSFVVRSLIGLIRNAGLLKKHHINRLQEAWHIYRTTWGADAQNATGFRAGYSHRVNVKFLGVWDTVGSNGIPGEDTDNCGFHDTVLSSCVENACHALAIDENRKQLVSCPWKTAPGRARTEQCWFTGSHRDIGGMGREMNLANISLGWMAMRAASLGLELDSRFLANAMEQRLLSKPGGDTSGNFLTSPRNGLSRPIGISNHDETLHSSAEQFFLRNQGYRPGNLKKFLARDEQIQLPL